MPIPDEWLPKLVSNPSFGAVSYQACALVEELKKIADGNYPHCACTIRDVLLCLVEHIQDELWSLYDSNDPYEPLGLMGAERTRDLARILHACHGYLRYLRASAPQSSPPEIQAALSHLAKTYFPEENGTFVCLVRPQSQYNLKYFSATLEIDELFQLWRLDPQGNLGLSQNSELLGALWKKRRSRVSTAERNRMGEVPPDHLAILSFPGLDTHDTLLYPLLAHELGHSIDSSFEPRFSANKCPDLSEKLDRKGIGDILAEHLKRRVDLPDIDAARTELVERAYVFQQELIADSLAIRMMGFGFFMAHAEFMKTMAKWPEPPFTPTGYPGMQLRLSMTFKHLFNGENPNSMVSFLQGNSDKTEAIGLLKYLDTWAHKLSTPHILPPPKSLTGRLTELAFTALQESLPAIESAADQLIPRDQCAILSQKFFARIDKLKRGEVPYFEDDSASSFSEIMSSAWAYELLHGEAREMTFPHLQAQFEEYRRSCQLSMKAIRRIYLQD